jgi:type II secretory pathway pseudopilin PulG
MEILTATVVVSILALMGFQSYTMIMAKAERGKCENNLRNLYVAATAYVTDQGQWPQIPVEDLEDPSYAHAWVRALQPYKIDRLNWLCPGIQKLLGNPPYDGDDARLDYIPAPFGDTPRAAYEWPNHPWFMERGDIHGDGNLLIFTNGNIRSLKQVTNDPKTVVIP